MTDLPLRAPFGVSKPAIRELVEPERTEALDEAVAVLVNMIATSDTVLLGRDAGAAVARYLGRPEDGSGVYIINHAFRTGAINHDFGDRLSLRMME